MKVRKNELIFFSMVLFILIILVSSYFVIPYIARDDLPESLGLFGDQFGAVNALFSGLAFAGLIYTILLQSDELEAQRTELKLTREEIEGQKLELKLQNETLALQRFETSFFNLLTQHNDFVRNFSVKLRNKETLLEGKNLISEAVADLEGLVNEQLGLILSIGAKVSEWSDINNHFADLNIKYNGILDAYVKSLYNIFQYVEKKGRSFDQSFYSNIITSQLTVKEKQLLGIYGLTADGKIFKDIIEDNRLLVAIPDTSHGLFGNLEGWGMYYKNVSVFSY